MADLTPQNGRRNHLRSSHGQQHRLHVSPVAAHRCEGDESPGANQPTTSRGSTLETGLGHNEGSNAVSFLPGTAAPSNGTKDRPASASSTAATAPSKAHHDISVATPPASVTSNGLVTQGSPRRHFLSSFSTTASPMPAPSNAQAATTSTQWLSELSRRHSSKHSFSCENQEGNQRNESQGHLSRHTHASTTKGRSMAGMDAGTPRSSATSTSTSTRQSHNADTTRDGEHTDGVPAEMDFFIHIGRDGSESHLGGPLWRAPGPSPHTPTSPFAVGRVASTHTENSSSHHARSSAAPHHSAPTTGTFTNSFLSSRSPLLFTPTEQESEQLQRSMDTTPIEDTTLSRSRTSFGPAEERRTEPSQTGRSVGQRKGALDVRYHDQSDSRASSCTSNMSGSSPNPAPHHASAARDEQHPQSRMGHVHQQSLSGVAKGVETMELASRSLPSATQHVFENAAPVYPCCSVTSSEAAATTSSSSTAGAERGLESHSQTHHHRRSSSTGGTQTPGTSRNPSAFTTPTPPAVEHIGRTGTPKKSTARTETASRRASDPHDDPSGKTEEATAPPTMAVRGDAPPFDDQGTLKMTQKTQQPPQKRSRTRTKEDAKSFKVKGKSNRGPGTDGDDGSTVTMEEVDVQDASLFSCLPALPTPTKHSHRSPVASGIDELSHASSSGHTRHDTAARPFPPTPSPRVPRTGAPSYKRSPRPTAASSHAASMTDSPIVRGESDVTAEEDAEVASGYDSLGVARHGSLSRPTYTPTSRHSGRGSLAASNATTTPVNSSSSSVTRMHTPTFSVPHGNLAPAGGGSAGAGPGGSGGGLPRMLGTISPLSAGSVAAATSCTAPFASSEGSNSHVSLSRRSSAAPSHARSLSQPSRADGRNTKDGAEGSGHTNAFVKPHATVAVGVPSTLAATDVRGGSPPHQERDTTTPPEKEAVAHKLARTEEGGGEPLHRHGERSSAKPRHTIREEDENTCDETAQTPAQDEDFMVVDYLCSDGKFDEDEQLEVAFEDIGADAKRQDLLKSLHASANPSGQTMSASGTMGQSHHSNRLAPRVQTESTAELGLHGVSPRTFAVSAALPTVVGAPQAHASAEAARGAGAGSAFASRRFRFSSPPSPLPQSRTKPQTTAQTCSEETAVSGLRPQRHTSVPSFPAQDPPPTFAISPSVTPGGTANPFGSALAVHGVSATANSARRSTNHFGRVDNPSTTTGTGAGLLARPLGFTFSTPMSRPASGAPAAHPDANTTEESSPACSSRRRFSLPMSSPSQSAAHSATASKAATPRHLPSPATAAEAIASAPLSLPGSRVCGVESTPLGEASPLPRPQSDSHLPSHDSNAHSTLRGAEDLSDTPEHAGDHHHHSASALHHFNTGFALTSSDAASFSSLGAITGGRGADTASQAGAATRTTSVSEPATTTSHAPWAENPHAHRHWVEDARAQGTSASMDNAVDADETDAATQHSATRPTTAMSAATATVSTSGSSSFGTSHNNSYYPVSGRSSTATSNIDASRLFAVGLEPIQTLKHHCTTTPPPPPAGPDTSVSGVCLTTSDTTGLGFSALVSAATATATSSPAMSELVMAPRTGTAPSVLDDPHNQANFFMRALPEWMRRLPRGKLVRGPGFSMTAWSALLGKARQQQFQQRPMLATTTTCPPMRSPSSSPHRPPEDGAPAARETPKYTHEHPPPPLRLGGPYARLTPSEIGARTAYNLTVAADTAVATGKTGKRECLMVIRKVVYDVYPFLAYHPGGEQVMLDCEGKEATAVFEAFHPWINCETMLGPFAVGVLEKEEA